MGPAEEFFWVVLFSEKSYYYCATMLKYTEDDMKLLGFAPVAAFKYERDALRAERVLNRACAR